MSETMRGVVAPLVGAWIEIAWSISEGRDESVAPLVGAWIEILSEHLLISSMIVAPLVGAWIEISSLDASATGVRSLPSWERGLKLYS